MQRVNYNDRFITKILLTMSIEMWQSTILESIGHTLATDGLLAHTGDHL